MSAIIEVFGEIPFGQVLLFLSAVAAIIVGAVKGYKKFAAFHDTRKAKRDLFEELVDAVKEIQTQQTGLIEGMKKLEASQRDLLDRQAKIESDTRKRKVNELRNQLLTSYRFYTDNKQNPLMAWSELEHDTFYAMYEDYIELHGNGFMHDTVEPSMAKLQIVHMFDTAGLAALFASRQNG